MDLSPYQYILSLSKTKIAFVDIDFTLSNHPEDTDIPQLLDHTITNKARKKLEEKGYLVVLTTSRTEEMLMSDNEYKISQEKYGFSRPPTKPSPEDIEPHGILDPPIIISSTGAKIFIRQPDGGYKEDKAYRAHLPSPFDWRTKTMDVLSKINHNFHLFSFSLIEYETNYNEGKTNVYPPDYRIQLSFTNKANLLRFKKHLSIHCPQLFILNDSASERDVCSLYVSPVNGKAQAANRVLNQLHASSSSVVLAIGDSYADLHESLNIQIPMTTLLLVGNSRLSNFFMNPQITSFAGEDLSQFKKDLLKIKRGLYEYRKQGKITTFIVSDEKYPCKVGPESIIEYLS